MKARLFILLGLIGSLSFAFGSGLIVVAQRSIDDGIKVTVLADDEAEMVLVPSGSFTMGQDGSKPKNEPAHTVDLPSFEIDKFEVTNDRFAYFVDETGFETYAERKGYKSWRDKAEGRGSHPVVYVTWDDAVAYCRWAGKRLPIEAEWEKAARGLDARIYPWGNDYGDPPPANVYERSIRDTVPVGSFPGGVSPYGVEDMTGNVREWTADPFLPYPGQDSDANPFFGEDKRIYRGGGWFDGEDGEAVTTYTRNAGPPGTSANDDIGFRCAKHPLSVFITPDPDPIRTPTTMITYTITITNNDIADATGVIITDTTPHQTHYVPNSASHNGHGVSIGGGGSGVTWPSTTVSTFITRTFQVDVKGSLTTGDKLTHIISIFYLPNRNITREIIETVIGETYLPLVLKIN